jgi:hypothetical protein
MATSFSYSVAHSPSTSLSIYSLETFKSESIVGTEGIRNIKTGQNCDSSAEMDVISLPSISSASSNLRGKAQLVTGHLMYPRFSPHKFLNSLAAKSHTSLEPVVLNSG